MTTQANASQIVLVNATKSTGVALILAVMFGPLGMLYATVSGAVIMGIISIVVGIFTVGFGLLLTWPISVVWAVMATNAHNRRVLEGPSR